MLEIRFDIDEGPSMFADIWDEFTAKGAGVVLGLVLGGVIGWMIAFWKRLQERRNIMSGDARDTIVIHHHLIETADKPGADGAMTKVPAVLRIRCVGQAELRRVVPNGHLANELSHRAKKVTERDTLISMEGAEGSYLLETLTNFVCDRINNGPFEHDLFVMAPCCEPAGLAQHQPITIILIAVKDLKHFESWPLCRDMQIEHGSEGARILTLMEMARRFRTEQEKIALLRQSGQKTRYVETMYILDLSMDKRAAIVPVKDVPWSRFAEVLKQMNLE
jgi:hypothetical protein